MNPAELNIEQARNQARDHDNLYTFNDICFVLVFFIILLSLAVLLMWSMNVTNARYQIN